MLRIIVVFKVWLCLLISIVIGVPSLYFVLRCISWINNKYRPNFDHLRERNRFTRAFAFIFGLLVVQGDLELVNLLIKIDIFNIFNPFFKDVWPVGPFQKIVSWPFVLLLAPGVWPVLSL